MVPSTGCLRQFALHVRRLVARQVLARRVVQHGEPEVVFARPGKVLQALREPAQLAGGIDEPARQRQRVAHGQDPAGAAAGAIFCRLELDRVAPDHLGTSEARGCQIRVVHVEQLEVGVLQRGRERCRPEAGDHLARARRCRHHRPLGAWPRRRGGQRPRGRVLRLDMNAQGMAFVERPHRQPQHPAVGERHGGLAALAHIQRVLQTLHAGIAEEAAPLRDALPRLAGQQPQRRLVAVAQQAARIEPDQCIRRVIEQRRQQPRRRRRGRLHRRRVIPGPAPPKGPGAAPG